MIMPVDQETKNDAETTEEEAKQDALTSRAVDRALTPLGGSVENADVETFDPTAMTGPAKILDVELGPGKEGDVSTEEINASAKLSEDATMDGPTWHKFFHKLQGLARARGHMFGYPIPVEGLRLIVNKRFPYQKMNGFTPGDTDTEDFDTREFVNRMTVIGSLFYGWTHDEDLTASQRASMRELLKESGVDPQHTPAFKFDNLGDWEDVNNWYNKKIDGEVVIHRHKKTGKVNFSLLANLYHPERRIEFAVANGLVATQAWQLTAELRAMENLRAMIKPHLFASYIMCGMFPETSKKSGVNYLLRKGRPTLALKENYWGRARFMTALCLHPTAYYAGSYAGGHVPTDDVIAHLKHIRADEHYYWRKANQHPLHLPHAGV
jgi:hypothetical protein